MATSKQVTFIENLMRFREIGDLYDTTEARAIRTGQGENLSPVQASRLIENLLACPAKSERREETYTVKAPKAPKTSLTVGSRVALNGHEEVTGTVKSMTNSKKGCEVALDAPALVMLNRGCVGDYNHETKSWVPTGYVKAGTPSDWHVI